MDVELLPKGLEVGGLAGSLLAGLEEVDVEHFEGLEVEQGLEAVTKDEAGTQGSACLAMNHTEDIMLKLNFLLSDRTMHCNVC